MENSQLIYESKITLGGAINTAFGEIGKFLGGLFRLNPKSAAIVSSGLILGVLAGIPIISWGSILWAILLGAYAIYLYIQRSPQPAQYTDGLVLGAIAGTIGSFVQLLISLILSLFYLVYAGMSSSAAYQQRRSDPFGLNPGYGFEAISALGTAGYLVITSVAYFIPLIILAMLGGLLGVVWFESRVSDSARVTNE